jgi:rod shape-determining protein MreC
MKTKSSHKLNQIIDYSLLVVSIAVSLYLIVSKGATLTSIALKSVVTDVSGDIQKHLRKMDDIDELNGENTELREELEKIYLENTKYKSSFFELHELKKNLYFKAPQSYQLKYSEVISFSANTHTRYILINKGKKDSLKINDPIVFRGNLVGKIIYLSDSYARVQLALDPLFEVSCRIQRNGEIGIISPLGTDLYQLKFITKNTDIYLGDVIISSGLSEIYPKSLKIGVVQSVRSDIPGLFHEITVKPSVDFIKLRYVTVLSKNSYSATDSIILGKENEK